MNICDKTADASCKGQCLQQEALAFGTIPSDRTVLVTGGARRIGRAICEALSSRGWRVIVHARRPDDPDAAELAKRIGGLSVAADLSEPLAAARLFQQVCDIAPNLCAIVNNAAIFSPAAEMEPKFAALIRRVNAEVPEKLTALLGLRLMEHPPFSGAVVDLLDCRALPSSPSGVADTPYLESKRLLRASMVKSAGLFASCLRVNAVAPGPVLAPSDPAVRISGGDILLSARPTPRDIAEAVAYLLDAPAVTGQVLAVDSGQSLLLV